jgi:hypothetical protein
MASLSETQEFPVALLRDATWSYLAVEFRPAKIPKFGNLRDRHFHLAGDALPNVVWTKESESFLQIDRNLGQVPNALACIIAAVADEVHHVLYFHLWHEEEAACTGASRTSHHINVPARR